MSPLYAVASDGTLLQFEMDRLKFFWPVRQGRIQRSHDGEQYLETLWCVATADGRWFHGPVQCTDGLWDVHPRHWGASCPYPRPSPPKAPTGRWRIEPMMARAIPMPRYFFEPVDLFREITPAAVAEWFYENLGRVPQEVGAIIAARAANGPAGTLRETPAAMEVPPQGDPESPAIRVVAAAYALRKEGKAVSLRAACERARADRASLRKGHPEIVALVKTMATPDRSPSRGAIDRRTGDVDAWDADDYDDD
jgi:hypothetical protein